MAVRSWLALAPEIGVVLFGKHPRFSSLRSPRARVAVETLLISRTSFLGTPFFHSMVARSQATHSDISILIDLRPSPADILQL
ncbi:hypothetical protein ACMD2_24804 [Ananas comosus]|uniref:Uncharacterized protein n=1 Tax=Ananas comosus TaxID=4615 RepID=A0A199UZR0_ANACO|nr:hypothetical protein ACMD2_24804 [Ananas comosus]